MEEQHLKRVSVLHFQCVCFLHYVHGSKWTLMKHGWILNLDHL